MGKLKAFFRAARLRTLPLSVSGIIVGASLGTSNMLQSSVFWLAIATTVGFQVLSNFANDYGDGIKGTDKNREGEQRLVASGIISAKAMKRAMFVTIIITLFVALLLIYKAFGQEYFGYSVLFFLLGIASITAAIKYTVGKNAYGYSGFGDIFVFLFFGWLSVAGSCFLFTKVMQWQVFLPATTIGLLSIAVLNLNNMRDVEYDTKAGKHTLVVKLGRRKAKLYHYALILAAFFSVFIYILLNYRSPQQFLCFMAFLPLMQNMLVVYKNKIPKDLDKELKKVALSTFLFAILFAIFI
ncbi:MAG: 1,4-dihydroxy-2-naphthoate octaprenyltransferase [Flavobacteriaceae bacterium]